MEQQTSSIEIYNRSIQTFSDGSMILSKHMETAMRATAAGQALLNKIEAAGGMNPELDKLANDHLSLASQRKTELENSRKPVTQIMDAVKALFTAEEAKIDVKKAGTMVYRIQEHRNNYARFVAEEQRRQQDEAQRKAAKEKEAAELRAECERRLNNNFSDVLAAEKTRIQNVFNGINLETFEGRKASLLAYTPPYSREQYNTFKPSLVSRLHLSTEVQEIVDSVTNFRYDTFSATYNQELLQLKQYLLDRLPSKLTELQQMAAANEQQKQILEDQRIQREKEEQLRLQQEEEARKKREDDAIAVKQAQAETLALFSGVPEATTAVPETRQGFEIVVKDSRAWGLMFNQWFVHEGAGLPLEKFGGKKLESIKTWCENAAHKGTVDRLDSPFLSYQPTYKAVNRKPITA